MTKEIWKKAKLKSSRNKKLLDIYEVSSLGNVYNKRSGKYLKGSKSKNGYIEVKMKDITDTKTYNVKLHILVIDTFSFCRDTSKTEVNHIDGNKKNNRLDNLEYVTHKENMVHARDTNLLNIKSGEENGFCKFSNDTIHTICQMLSEGYMPKYISDTLDIRLGYIYKIKYRKARLDISSNYDW